MSRSVDQTNSVDLCLSKCPRCLSSVIFASLKECVPMSRPETASHAHKTPNWLQMPSAEKKKKRDEERQRRGRHRICERGESEGGMRGKTRNNMRENWLEKRGDDDRRRRRNVVMLRRKEQMQQGRKTTRRRID